MTRDELAMTIYGDRRGILLIASQPADDAVVQAATASGFALSDPVPPGEALARIDGRAALDCVWLRLAADSPSERLIGETSRRSAADGWSLVVDVPMAGIDAAVAACVDEGAAIVSRPRAYEARATLERLMPPSSARLHDSARQPRLQQLSEEVGRIAAALATLSEEEDGGQPAPGEGGDPLDAAAIRGAIRARRLRDRHFPEGLFADPAWDMLLDLMAARLENQRVAVSSLCIAAAVPPTTALRWIKALTESGLFVRRNDPEDRRRVYIALSDDAAARFETYLRAALRMSPLTI